MKEFAHDFSCACIGKKFTKRLISCFEFILKKCEMVSVFTLPDVNTWEVGRTRDKRRKPRRDERGTKTVFTYAHVKWFYGQSERAYYLNYFINFSSTELVFEFINNQINITRVCFFKKIVYLTSFSIGREVRREIDIHCLCFNL